MKKKELNIAAILKDKPVGIKLWSPIVGNCTFKGISPKNGAIVASFINKDGGQLDWDFNEYGKTLYAPKEAEVCLFPSKQMLNWSKFAWKKGDVLKSGLTSSYCIFERFINDEYTQFIGRYVSPEFNNKDFRELSTSTWTNNVDDNVKISFIHNIESHYGGKLNLETLDIEEPKQEFKDGDIVYCPAGDITDEIIFIAKVEAKGVLHSYVYMSKDNMKPYTNSLFSVSGCLDNLRLATDSEKKQLFDALAKENKRWNPYTLQVEDLPKKCEFKAFQKVLTRDTLDEKWIPNLFSNYNREHSDYMYGCIAGGVYSKYCIPYNKETAHLLGTTDEWKGGK